MITIIQAIAVAAAIMQSQSVVNDRLLDAVRQVESSGNDKAVSRAGARGPYQFMPKTWAEWSNDRPFNDAFDPVISRQVAFRYLVWIEVTIEKWSGNPATLEQVCSAYNGGIGRLRKCGFNWEWMPTESVNYVHKIKAELK